MEYNDKKLLTLEGKLTNLLTNNFHQSILNGYYSSLQMKALLLKHKYIKQYYKDVASLAIIDTINFIGVNRFPVYASNDEKEITDYMIPYIIFFMEQTYDYTKRMSLENNISLEEAFNKFGKNRLAIFISSSVNGLYNETIVKTSRQANIKYFRFIAVIDARTSMICRSLNQKILSEFQSYFFPELHPHCRSKIEPVIGKFDNNKIFNGQLRATDMRRLSWYKSTYACNINDLNIDALLIKYL